MHARFVWQLTHLRPDPKTADKMNMHRTREELEKGHLKSLRPSVDDDGIIVLSSRAVKGFKHNYNRDHFPILTSSDPLAQLWMREVHSEEHSELYRELRSLCLQRNSRTSKLHFSDNTIEIRCGSVLLIHYANGIVFQHS